MVRSLRSLVVLCAFAFVAVGLFVPARLIAQPLARFVAPTNTTEAALQPTFRVVTKYKIDTTSVHFARFRDSILPTLCVLNKKTYQSSPDSTWQYNASQGTGSILNDSTFEFQPKPLTLGTNYVIVIKGLRLVNGPDTIVVPDTVRLSFSTVPPLVHCLNVSCLSNGFVLKHDTVSVYFSSKLDSVNSGGGSLVDIYASISAFDSLGDSTKYTDSLIYCKKWLDPADSSIIHLLPDSSFKLGQRYQAAVTLSNLTADTSQNLTSGFYCKQNYRLNIVAQPSSGLSSLDPVHFSPTINELYYVKIDSANDTTIVLDTNSNGVIVKAGDTVRYQAPQKVGSAVFKQWSSPGNPAINGSTNLNLMVTLGADALHDINVVAQYAPVPMDTICTSVAGSNCAATLCDYIEVKSTQLAHSNILDTCKTNCSYAVEDGTITMLHAYSMNDSIVFDHWSSADPHVDGSTSPLIYIKPNGGNVCAVGHFMLIPTPWPINQYSLCAYINYDNGQAASSSDAIVEVPTAPPCDYEIAPASLRTQIHILNPKVYGLLSYTIDDPSTGTHIVHDMSVWNPEVAVLGLQQPTDLSSSNGIFNPTETTNLTSPTTHVTFVISKLIRELRVIVKMDDKQLPDGTNLTTNPNGPLQKMWCIAENDPAYPNDDPLIYNRTGAPRRGIEGTCSQYFWTSHLMYYSGTHVKLICGANQSYQFLHWESSAPNPDDCPIGAPSDWPTPTTNPVLSLKMDQDRSVIGTFSLPFKLISISFYQWDKPAGINPATDQDPWGGDPWSGKPVWQTFLADDWDKNVENTNSSRAWGYGLWGPSSTWGPPTYSGIVLTPAPDPHIVLHFNKPVSATSGQTFGVIMHEMTDAYARNGTSGRIYRVIAKTTIQSDFSHGGSHNMPAVQTSSQDIEIALGGKPWGAYVSPDGIVTVTCENNWSVWKGQQIKLDVNSDIQSVAGDQLSNPHEFVIHSETPDIFWIYRNSHLGDSPLDWWCCDYDAWTAIRSNTRPSSTSLVDANEMSFLGSWFDAALSCADVNGEDGEDMGYKLPSLSNLDPFSPAYDAHNAALMQALHCWSGRQFELAARVFGSYGDCNFYCNGGFDTKDSKRFWGYDKDLQTGVAFGTLDDFFNSNTFVEDDDEFSFGVAYYNPTSSVHWTDWWGAAPSYGIAHGSNGELWKQWSDKGFRADITVVIH